MRNALVEHVELGKLAALLALLERRLEELLERLGDVLVGCRGRGRVGG